MIEDQKFMDVWWSYHATFLSLRLSDEENKTTFKQFGILCKFCSCFSCTFHYLRTFARDQTSE